jgi:hypothetical protein
MSSQQQVLGGTIQSPRRRTMTTKKMLVSESDYHANAEDSDAQHPPILKEVESVADAHDDAATHVPTQLPSRRTRREIAEYQGSPDSDEGAPGDLLLELQLLEVAPNVRLSSNDAIRVVNDDVKALYQSLAPRNALESLLARQLIAANNVTMESYRNVLRQGGDTAVAEVFLKYALKGSAICIEAVKAYQELRRNAQQDVQINNVNVQAGAHAIVGRIEVAEGRQSTPNAKLVHQRSTREEDQEQDEVLE